MATNIVKSVFVQITKEQAQALLDGFSGRSATSLTKSGNLKFTVTLKSGEMLQVVRSPNIVDETRLLSQATYVGLSGDGSTVFLSRVETNLPADPNLF